MVQFHPAWLERRRRYYTRADGHRWIKPNGKLYLKPKPYEFKNEPDQSDPSAEIGELLHMRGELAAIKAELKFWGLLRERKALHPPNHNLDQPRVPAGSREGGQWMRIASLGKVVIQQLLRAALRLRLSPPDSAIRRATNILNRVRHLDPLWQPKSISDEGIAQEAEKRLAEFADLPPDKLIALYRERNSMPDLFDQPTWRLDKGTVAVTKIDGLPEFGINSKAPGYERVDTESADTARRLLIETHPDEMKWRNIGQKPNDSVYHAESTVLLRAARRYGGTLEGRTLEVQVDRDMCPSCDKVLPLLGQELGNPTVTYINMRTGERATMQDGKWINRVRP
jgi:hypothetical protein